MHGLLLLFHNDSISNIWKKYCWEMSVLWCYILNTTNAVCYEDMTLIDDDEWWLTESDGHTSQLMNGLSDQQTAMTHHQSAVCYWRHSAGVASRHTTTVGWRVAQIFCSAVMSSASPSFNALGIVVINNMLLKIGWAKETEFDTAVYVNSSVTTATHHRHLECIVLS